MKKYIDPEAFFKVINTLPYKDTSYPDASAYNGAISDVADMLMHFPAADVLMHFPAADVQEVRHGRWIWDDEGYHCSECWWHAYGNTLEITQGEWRYCPHCGAHMIEEETK